jgi:hypothetical protein
MLEAKNWEHKNCGGQPREFESEKWDCTKCKRRWYAGSDFFTYLARIVFVEVPDIIESGAMKCIP